MSSWRHLGAFVTPSGSPQSCLESLAMCYAPMEKHLDIPRQHLRYTVRDSTDPNEGLSVASPDKPKHTQMASQDIQASSHTGSTGHLHWTMGSFPRQRRGGHTYALPNVQETCEDKCWQRRSTTYPEPSGGTRLMTQTRQTTHTTHRVSFL